MSWSQARLAAWLDHVEPALERLNPFELLEIPPTASGDHVQRAFHAIASSRHPDLWRNVLAPRQAERLVRIYGRVTAAYATLRDPEQRSRVILDVRERRPRRITAATAAGERDAPGAVSARGSGPAARTTTPARGPTTTPARGPTTPPARSGPTTPPERLARATVPTDPPAPAARPAAARAATGPTQPQLGARALGFYRRAEAALRVGDVAGAVLNLRMAVAAEPTSGFLRDMLAEAQAQLRR